MSGKGDTAAAVPTVSQLFDLGGTVALVTGAGSGFGRVIARRLADAGARIAVHYRRSRDGATEVVRTIEAAGGEARVFAADLTHHGEPRRLFVEVAATPRRRSRC
jgi:3-oxoacyl-[acyl-carrier protein] reductase